MFSLDLSDLFYIGILFVLIIFLLIQRDTLAELKNINFKKCEEFDRLQSKYLDLFEQFKDLQQSFIELSSENSKLGVSIFELSDRGNNDEEII